GSGTGGAQSYQWLANGLAVSGATQNTLSTSISGNYQLVITENTCDDTSNVVGVTVAFPPSVSLFPSGLQNLCGGTSLNMNAAGGNSYQWYFNSQPIAGATLPNYTALQAGIYYVVVGDLNNCTTISVPTTVNFLPQATAQINPTGTIQICQGEDITLLAGGGIVTGWLMNGQLLPNSAQPSLNITSTGAYQAVVSGVCNTDTSSMTVVGINPLPTATISPAGNYNICEGKDLLLTAGGGSTYQWLQNGQAITGATASTLNINQTGIYYAEVTNSVNCKANTPIINVNLLPNPVADISALTNPIFCEGQAVTLWAKGGDTYQWLVNGTPLLNYINDSLTVTQSNQYQIIATNSCSSDSSSFIYTEVIPKPIANFNVLEDKIYPNTNIHFIDSSQYAGQWNWSYGDNTGITSTQNPTHSYDKIGDYPVVLIVSDGVLGCSDTMYYTLKVVPLPKVFVPNVFSPNEDGNYDDLVIEYGELSEIDLKIFDRWGAIMFDTSDKNLHWDGRNKQGGEAPKGVYFYQLSGKNESGQKLYYKGNVSLIK
ncbi:MAG: gliding motility-associated C-terminal domain-containing protein, partial [Bacteroidia bacterium]